MKESFNNYSEQGNIGFSSAIHYFSSIKCTVSIPLNDCQKYDLIVDDGIDLKKVSVKTATTKSNSNFYRLYLRTVSGRKVVGCSHENTDVTFVLCADSTMYCIPNKVLSNYKNTVVLNSRFNTYKVYFKDINNYL